MAASTVRRPRRLPDSITPLLLRGPHVEQHFRRTARRRHHAVAEIAEKLLQELPHVDPLPQRGIQFGQGRRNVAAGQVADQLSEESVVRGPQHGMHVGQGNPAGREGQQLIQERLAVAHRAGGAAGQHLQGLRLRLTFSASTTCRSRSAIAAVEIPGEIEPLAPRQDRDGDLGRLGRAEDELHVLRRLFQGLQQGVERLAGEHVDFVDNVNLEARPAGPHVDVLPQLADLVDAAVAGPVDLQYVHVFAAR